MELSFQLWSRILINFEPKTHDRAALYLSRSGPTAPLDIDIDIAGYVVRPSHLNAAALKKYLQNTRYIFTFITARAGAASRWRSLRFEADILEAHSLGVEFLISSRMISLQCLNTAFLGKVWPDPDDQLVSRTSVNTSPDPWLLNSLPCLRVARLSGIPNYFLFGRPSQPQLTSLTRLELEFVEHHPKPSELLKTLSACPKLAVLCLKASKVYDVDHTLSMEASQESAPRAHLPNFQALSFWDITTPKWDHDVLAMIEAPNLSVLRITSDLFGYDEEEFTCVIDLLACGIKQNTPGPYFPALTHLSYATVSDPTDHLRTLLAAYCNITSLSLPGGPSLTALFDQPWLAPRLARLIAPAQRIQDLNMLAAARREAGIALHTIEIDWRPRDSDVILELEQLGTLVEKVVTYDRFEEGDDMDPMAW